MALYSTFVLLMSRYNMFCRIYDLKKNGKSYQVDFFMTPTGYRTQRAIGLYTFNRIT